MKYCCCCCSFVCCRLSLLCGRLEGQTNQPFILITEKERWDDSVLCICIAGLGKSCHFQLQSYFNCCYPLVVIDSKDERATRRRSPFSNLNFPDGPPEIQFTCQMSEKEPKYYYCRSQKHVTICIEYRDGTQKAAACCRI